MEQAAQSARLAVDLETLVRAFAHSRSIMSARDAGDAVADVFEHELRENVRDALLETLVAGAKAEARGANAKGSFRAARKGLGASFNSEHARARTWAEQRAARLVTQVGGETRDAIRGVIGRAFVNHTPPIKAAREIRGLVGLTNGQSAAVEKLRAKLEAADGETVSAFGERMRFRVPEGGVDDDQIEAWTERYSDRLLKWRAENIARTETIAAANEGQRELWEQSVESGLLDQDAKRVWIAANDESLCPICSEMDGEEVSIREDFTLPDGDSVSGPPAHPQCRCAQGIA